MKLTKKLEEEIKLLMDDYWNSYFDGNLDHWANYLVNDFRNIGGNQEEIWNSKKEMLDYTNRVIGQVKGMSEIRNKQVQIVPYDPYVMVHEFMDLYIKVSGKLTFYGKFRLSSLIQKTAKGWKVLHQHGSYPDSKNVEGEAFAFDEIKAENIKLKEAVKRRTIELEQKNRELEIETALEKVRIIAMCMKEPADMPDVCKNISLQLQSLGVENIRHVQTAIFYESRKTYMSYVYYLKHNKKIITETSYTHHKTTKAFAAKMIKGKGEFFVKHLKGKKIQDWITYQKTTSVFIDPFLEKANSLSYYWHSLGPVALGVSTYEPLSKNDLILFKRFLHVFELAYTRYLDIEQALAQAREAQIEASLERVRSVAMGMSKPDNLLNIAESVFQELRGLGFTELRNAIIQTFEDDKKYFDDYDFSDVTGGWISRIPYTGHPIIERFVKNIRKNKDAFVETVVSGKEMEEWMEFRETNGEVKDPRLYGIKELFYYHYSIGEGDIGISTFSSISAEKQNLLKRFRNVFDLAYRRYTDIQKAEAQTREATIEAALESVRASSMAMHHSEELEKVVKTLSDKLIHLGLSLDGALIFFFDKEKKSFHLWIATNHLPAPIKVNMPYDEDMQNNPIIKNLWAAIETGTDLMNQSYSGDEKDDYFRIVAKNNEKKIPEAIRTFQLEAECWTLSLAAGKNSVVGIDSWSGKFITPQDFQVLKKFAKVFEQAYTRFLDLQKAEAQAREAEIELAMERVRARAMTMQKSVELKDVIIVVFEKLKELGVVFENAGIQLFREDSKDIVQWVAAPNLLSAPALINLLYSEKDYQESEIVRDYWNSKENGNNIYNKRYSFEEKNRFFEYAGRCNNLAQMPEKAREAQMQAYDYTQTLIAGKHSALWVDSYSGQTVSVEGLDVLKRTSKVFEQAYTRFLDLQKAEAQAREAQIEAALERVRSRAMAMQKSEELKGLIATVSAELGKLDFVFDRCFIMIFDHKTKDSVWWMSHPESPEPAGLFVKYHEHLPYLAHLKAWKERQVKWEYILEDNVKKTWDEFLFNETELANLPQEVKANMRGLEKVYFSSSFNNFGCLSLATLVPLPNDLFEIMLRFAKVFDLTYTRFNDLKVAEAQAKEARIEAALERVRSKAMSMYSSEELTETIRVFYQQISLLNGTPQRCGVSLFNKETHNSEFTSMYTTKEGECVEIIAKLKLTGHPVLESMYEHWLLQKEYHPVLRGNEIKEYYQFIRPQVSFPDYAHDHFQYGYYFFFPEGTVYAWTEEEMKEEELQIYRRFTSVLSLTYKRYKDLNGAEAHAKQAEEDLIKLQTEKRRAEDALIELRVTQKQLIQSEKMASLGELTAGIAHEIQNPLNFVNNFSEVSRELIDELKTQKSKFNSEELDEILNDIDSNLEKINHHGKRADAIVKGMLQHSRASSAQKEPTDINALCDEYLRLSYHGLRAKDKSFNTTFKTDFDPSLQQVNIVPQDIGRVILNLLTNAFYAVNEKKTLRQAQGECQSELAEDYEPTVSISTKKINNKVEIKVSDNGNGIPQKVLDKIFQPFFTTKPTGQGTGLGLSLSYDIIKAHGGELRVETTEGVGSEFIIFIPINLNM